MKTHNYILYVLNDKFSFADNGLPTNEIVEFFSELSKHGIKVKVFQPFFDEILDTNIKMEEIVSDFHLQYSNNIFNGTFYKANLPDSDIEIICLKTSDKNFNIKSFFNLSMFNSHEIINYISFFSHSLFSYVRTESVPPIAVNCFGWQTGLIPALYKNIYSNNPIIPKMKILFSINNFYSQGNFDSSLFPITGLPWSSFNLHEMEFWGNFSLLKSGIVYSDHVFIFGHEQISKFLNDEYSFGLRGVFECFRKKITGIPIGVNYSKWNPKNDEFINIHYSKYNCKSKGENKSDLLKDYGINFANKNLKLVAIFGSFSPYLNDENINNMFEVMRTLEVNFLICGVNNIEMLNNSNINEYYKDSNIYIHRLNDVASLHRIFSASDILLMPSHLGIYPYLEYHALAYGVVPVISDKLGFDFDIQNYNRNYKVGNGFVFSSISVISILGALISAINAINYEGHYLSLLKNTMNTNVLWKTAAEKFLKVIKIVK